MPNVEELQDEILKLCPEEFDKLRNWFWEQDSIAWDAQIEADSKSGKLDRLIAASRCRLPLSDQECDELDRALAAYEADGNLSRPAEDVIADIRKRLSKQERY